MCKKIFLMLLVLTCFIVVLNLSKVNAAVYLYRDEGGGCRHTYVNRVMTKYVKSYATCTSPAIYYKSCCKCGMKSSNTFTFGMAFGHNYINSASAKYIKSYATCTSPAIYYKSCSKCGAKGDDTFTSGKALGHNYINSVSVKHIKSYATCTSPAIYYKSCSRCGRNGSGSFRYGTALGHLSSMPRNNSNLKSAATCTSPAVYYKFCLRCRTNLKETFVSGTALGHNYGSENKCIRCGKEGTKFHLMAVLGDGQNANSSNSLTQQKELKDLSTSFDSMGSGGYGDAQSETVRNLNKNLNRTAGQNSNDRNVLMGYSHGGQITSKLVKYNPGKNEDRAINKVDDLFILDGVDFQMSDNKRENEKRAENYLNGLIDNAPEGMTIHLYASGDSRGISKASKLSIDVLESMSNNNPGRIVDLGNGKFAVKDEKGKTVLTFETEYFEDANHGNLCEKAAPHMESELKH